MQDFGCRCLDRKISHGARVDAGRALHGPTVRRADFELEPGSIDNVSARSPRTAESAPATAPGSRRPRTAKCRYVRRASERPSPYWIPSTTVLNRPRTALRSGAVMLSDRKPSWLGDAEIDVAGFAGLQQRAIPGQHRGDPHLLLAEVPMDQSAAGRWRDQEPHPLRRAEHELAMRRARCGRSWCRRAQGASIAAVATDREIVEPQLRQRVAQLPQRADDAVLALHLAEGLVASRRACRSRSVGQVMRCPAHSQRSVCLRQCGSPSTNS